MVTECCNKGVVTVYNREVKFKRHIQCTTHDPLSGLSIESHRHLYVCDYWNLKILVYSKVGELLRSFGSSNDYEKSLKNPCSVSAAGQYVYAVDECRDDVVFSNRGEYVTEFSSHNTFGVCVDQDRFVCITDYLYGCVCIY